MAVSEDTIQPLEYRDWGWGESILGSKKQLQQLGIGEGLMFPGEPDGPKRVLNILDPRGFPCRVTEFYDKGYFAHISLPGRERPKAPAPEDFAPGVRKRSDCVWYDEYIGTGEALVAAGLVCVEHLPGQPGVGKVAVTVFADGTVPINPRAAGVGEKRRRAGAKWISRVSKGIFEVRIIIPPAENVRRIEARKRVDSEYELRMKALPRPAPLVQKTRAAEAAKRRATMRLVWSRPAFQPGLML